MRTRKRERIAPMTPAQLKIAAASGLPVLCRGCKKQPTLEPFYEMGSYTYQVVCRCGKRGPATSRKITALEGWKATV